MTELFIREDQRPPVSARLGELSWRTSLLLHDLLVRLRRENGWSDAAVASLIVHAERPR